MDTNFTPRIGDFPVRTPFRFWCQTVLPLVYDDSLSYYELLCKVVKYLNNMIGDVTQLETATTELANGLAQLDNYVKNYFNNLDVSAEINDKLDEMASDGTLATIFSRFVVRSYSLASDMISDTTLAIGNICETAHYYAGDKYGCRYEISALFTGDSVALDNGLYAHPLGDVSNFGYCRDNDFDLYLQYALNRYKKVKICEGNYTVSSQITVTENNVDVDFGEANITVNVEISDPYASGSYTGIKFDNCNVNFSGGTFTFSPVNPVDQTDEPFIDDYVHMTGYCGVLFYQCDNVKLEKVKMVSCHSLRAFVFEDCDFIDTANLDFNGVTDSTCCFAGLLVRNYYERFTCVNSNFTNFQHLTGPVDERGHTQLFCYPIATTHTARGHKMGGLFDVHDCNFENCSWEGVDTHGSIMTNIHNCRFHNCGRFFTAYHDSRYGYTDNGGTLTISNCYAENDSSYTSVIDQVDQKFFTLGSSSGYKYDVINIKGCYFKMRMPYMSGGENCCQMNFGEVNICDTTFDLMNSAVRALWHYYAHATYTNVKFRNSRSSSAIVGANCSIITVHNCVYESDGLDAPYSVFSYRRSVHYMWDNYGLAKGTGSDNMPRGIVGIGSGDLVKAGDWVRSAPDLTPIGIFTTKLDSSLSPAAPMYKGYGLCYQVSGTSPVPELYTGTVVSGENRIEIGQTSTANTDYGMVEGLIVQLDYVDANSNVLSTEYRYVLTTYCRPATAEELVANPTIEWYIGFRFNRAFTETGTVVFKGVAAKQKLFTFSN